MANDNEIQIVIQVATAQGKAQIKDFTNTSERELKGFRGNARKYLGMAGVAGIVATATGTVVAGFNRMIEKGREFQSSLAELEAITGISGDQLDQLSDNSLELSKQYGAAASEIVEANKLVASQLAEKIDFNTEEGLQQLQDVAEQATVLKTAAGIDLATAVETTTGIINQFNLEAEESERVINNLAAGSKYGAAEVGDINRALVNAGSAAAGANVSLEETNSAIQVLAANGQRGERAGTALRAIFTRLQTSGELLAENGIKNVNIESDGLVGTLEKLEPLLEDTAAMKKIFGEEALNQIQILIRETEAIESLNEKTTDTQVAYEQAEVQMSTFDNAQSRLVNTLDAELIPAFQETNGVMVQTMELLANLTEATGNAIRGLNDIIDRRSRIENMAGESTLFDYGHDRHQEAMDILEEIEQQTRDTIAEINNIGGEMDFFEEQREDLEKGSEKWEDYTRAIKNNEDELLSIRSSLEDQRDGLLNAMQSVDRGTRQYNIWKEMLREVEKQLDAAKSATDSFAESQENAGDGAGDDAKEEEKKVKGLSDQIEELEGEYKSLINQPNIDAAGLFEAEGIQARIRELKQLKAEREALTGAGDQEDGFDLESDVNSLVAGLDEDVEEEEEEAHQRRMDRIDETGEAAEESGKEGEKAMMGLARAGDMVAGALAQAVVRGENLGGVMKSLAAQLGQKALMTGLSFLLPGGPAIGGASFFGQMFGMSEGGPVYAAGGGKIYGPGTTTSDSIPAWLSDQEYVVNAASANAMPDALEAANSNPSVAGAINRIFTTTNSFAGGGRVGSVPNIPEGNYPSLNTIDRVIEVSRQDQNMAGFEMVSQKLEDQTKRLEQVQRRVEVSMSQFEDARDKFNMKENEVGRG